jgi:ketosteroid isomerase-like protein
MLRAVIRLTGVAFFVVAVPVGAQQASEEGKIRSFLESYDAAFNSKDLEKLQTFYHPDVTIFEGGGVNRGWSDYRDHHLGPELKDFENLKFAHTNVTPRLLDSGGRTAYVTAE